MNRREMLKSMLSAFAAAAATKLLPAHVLGIKCSSVEKFAIRFPDGAQWSFDGVVKQFSPTMVSVEPVGQILIEQTPTVGAYEEVELEDVYDQDADPGVLEESQGAVISRDGLVIGELQNIAAPSIDAHLGEVTFGLRRVNDITFEGRFQ